MKLYTLDTSSILHKEIADVSSISIFINNARLDLCVKDGCLNIYKTEGPGRDQIQVLPQSTNVIEIK